MTTYFKNKNIVITGATSGIGKALTELFLKMNAKVTICARNQENLMEFKNSINNPNLFVLQTDVSNVSECKSFIQYASEQMNGIDILINNAGISMRATFEDVDLAVLKKSMEINYWGTVYCSKFALPFILKSKGTILGVSSIAGYKGLPCRTGYSSSKFAMQGFLESLRIEMLHRGVNVMWVSPGFVASNIRNTALNATGNAQQETPLEEKNLMTPEECALRISTAIEQRKRTVIMTIQGKLTVWINKFFPSFIDKQVFKHFANEPDSPLKS
jgi:short-subunit dehydrogenase